MNKCVVKIKKAHSTTITFNNLTNGEMLALRNALNNYQSAIGQDLKAYVDNAFAVLPRESLREVDAI